MYINYEMICLTKLMKQLWFIDKPKSAENHME